MSSLEIEIDPFAFYPELRKKFLGEVESVEGVSPDLVFHTEFVYAATGDALFSFAFAGLGAESAPIEINVDVLGSKNKLSAQSIIVTPDKAADGVVHLKIEFPAQARHLYALTGRKVGPQAFHATAVGVSLVRGADENGARRSLPKIMSNRTPIMSGIRKIPRATGLATLANPVSQMCTASQFGEPVYDKWIGHLRSAKQYHRKQWEFAWILAMLEHAGMLKQGFAGLGFGCGQERLPALFASMGCRVVATDLSRLDDRSKAWSASGQLSRELSALQAPDICPNEDFERLVIYRDADMNNISSDLAKFDFCWSACAFEHLGSIDAGLDFVENSLKTLRVGGVAVHTTELNLSSNGKTVSDGPTVLFRRRDFEKLARRLIKQGHYVWPLNFDSGDEFIDHHIDVPPYTADSHLKLLLAGYVTTSFGFAVRKGS